MNYDKYSVKELQDICNKLGLPVSRKKADMLENLNNYYRVDNNQLFNESVIRKIPDQGEPIKSYYALTKIANLYSYLNSALIYPLIYEESTLYRAENRHQDIFTRFPECIILSPTPFIEISVDDVFIKIIVNGLPIKPTNVDNIFYVAEPIPLSRVSKLLFADQAKKNNFLSSLKTFPDSAINAQLCSVLPNKSNYPYPELSKLSFQVPIASFTSQQLAYYDKLLGMFAFMKNASIFYADREGVYQEYPNTFFSTLHLLNPAALQNGYKENTLVRFLLFPGQMEVNTIQRFIFKLIIDSIIDNVVFDFPLANNILNAALAGGATKPEEKTDLEIILRKMTLLSERRLAYRDLMHDDLFKKNLPTMCLLLLTRFGNKNKQHTDKQSIRNIFVQNEDDISKTTAEFLLAVLGLYYGYREMVREDFNLNFHDKNFEKAAQASQNIKFRLKNRLERMVIETVFQFSKNQEQLNNKFEFLRSDDDEKLSIFLSRNGTFDYKVSYNSVLDSTVLQVDRVNLLENILIAIDETYPDKLMSNQYIVHYILSTIGLDKSAIISLIRRYPDRITIEDIDDVIKFDRIRKRK